MKATAKQIVATVLILLVVAWTTWSFWYAATGSFTDAGFTTAFPAVLGLTVTLLGVFGGVFWAVFWIFRGEWNPTITLWRKRSNLPRSYVAEWPDPPPPRGSGVERPTPKGPRPTEPPPRKGVKR